MTKICDRDMPMLLAAFPEPKKPTMKKIQLSVIVVLMTILCRAQPPMIAYNVAVKDSAGKSNYEVFTMRADGSMAKNITRHKDVAWTYKAHQKDLYFISDRDTCFRCYFLYKTNADGGPVQKVSNLQLEDSWMDLRDEGQEMVVTGRLGKDVRYQVFLINLKNGQFRQITFDTAAHFRDPVFSPDGRQLAVVYRKNKRDRSIKDEIFLLSLSDQSLKQLTRYPLDKMPSDIPGYTAGGLRWHPTENFISYISSVHGRHNIYRIQPDGTGQRRLTSNEMTEGWHDWSPDGKWLVFDSSNPDETQYHIMLMNWTSKSVRQLTTNAHAYQQSPVFLW